MSSKNCVDISEFKRLLHNQKRAAWHAFPMRHYLGMISVEVIDSTDEKEGGYNVWVVASGSDDVSLSRGPDSFYKFSEWQQFEMDILRKMHPQFICACAESNTCFSTNCKIKPV